MGKGNNPRLWAMFLVTVMVTSTFVGLSTLVVGTNGAPDGLDTQPISNERIEQSYFDTFGRQPVNMNAINNDILNEVGTPTPMSPPPQPETQGVWTYDFDGDTVGQWPAAPPWNYGLEPIGQTVAFGADDFEDDVLGENPDYPPWFSIDGNSIVGYWTEDFEGFAPGQDLSAGAISGSDGYFGNFVGGATLTAEPAPAGAPPGSILPGYDQGAISAYFTDPGGGSYWGPAGIGDTTTAYGGGWVYMQTVARFDFLFYDLAAGATRIEVALMNDNTLMHWPGGVPTTIPGPTYAVDEWHELYIQYDETTSTYSVWWDGVEYVAGSAFNAAGGNCDSMIWFGDIGDDVYVDNFFHFLPPAGLTHAVDVSDVNSNSGAQSIWFDQNGEAAPDLAMMTTSFDPPLAGTGSWDYWMITDTVAGDTDGAFAELTNQAGSPVIQLRANGGNFQYNDGGTWTDALVGYAPDMEYNFHVDFDTTAKTFTLDIDSVPAGAGAFLLEAGTIAGLTYSGTGGTQSEHYIDDVNVTCNGADANITVSNAVSHSAPNSLRFQEYNAIDFGYIGADQLGTGMGAVGSFSFWFYNTENVGGQTWELGDTNGGDQMTLISLGINLASLEANPGVVQLVNNDGAGLWVVDGPTYNANEWHQITIEFDCLDTGVSSSTGTYYYRWDGGALNGPYGMIDPITYFDYLACMGGSPGTNSYGDFYYDDFYIGVNGRPGGPTNCWAELPAPTGLEVFANYSTDLDIPVEGIITGTEANTHTVDGTTQDIREEALNDVYTWANLTTDMDIPDHGIIAGTEANTHGAGTEDITEVPIGGWAFANYTTDLDIPGNGTVVGTEAATHGAGTQTFTEVQFGGDVWANYTTALDVPSHGTVVGTEAATHGAGTQDITEAFVPGIDIRINEFVTGMDRAEFINFGAVPVDLSGWTWWWHDARVLEGQVTFGINPAIYTLDPGECVLLLENAGVDTATTWYVGHNMMWDATSGGVAGELRTPAGEGYDFFVTGGDTSVPTAPDVWLGPAIPDMVPDGCNYRHLDDDTNTNADWTYVSGGTGTPNVPNPGQTGASPPAYSLQHDWQMQNVSVNASVITLYVDAATNAGSDDTFTISYSADGMAWTDSNIVINSDIMMTYTDILVLPLAGEIFLRVVDDNRYDVGLQDTVIIDNIRLEYYHAIPFWQSVDHVWRTQPIVGGYEVMTLFMDAATNAGPDDFFDVFFGLSQTGPWTYAFTVDSDTMQTYSAILPNTTVGAMYIQIRDDTSGDTVQQDTLIVDNIRVMTQAGLPTQMSVDHVWRTEVVPFNALWLDLYVDAAIGLGSTDSFSIYYGGSVAGANTFTGIVVNSDVMQTYYARLAALGDNMYLKVLDGGAWNQTDAIADTVIIDNIRIEATFSSAVTVNQVATADNPDHGLVTGTFALTTSIPPDGAAQQIDEIDLSPKATSGPTPLSERPDTEPRESPTSDTDISGIIGTLVYAMNNPNHNIDLDASSISQPFSNGLPRTTPLSPGPGPQPTAQVYYNDRAIFDTDAGPLPIEDFEASSAAPGTINGMDAPLDEFTNNAFFAPGDILPGIRIQDNPGPDAAGLVALGVGGGGCPTLTVSTNTFVDSCDIWFDNPAVPVFAIGMDVQTYIAAGTVDIQIFGIGGVLLDTVSVPGDNTGVFWGVISDEQIESINMYEQAGAAVECGDNIAFGEPLRGNSLQHNWTMELQPADSTERTLFVTARTDVATNETFTFAYSNISSGGPWTDAIVVDSDVFQTYSAPLPIGMSGPLWLNVEDNDNKDDGPMYVSSVFVDSIRILNDNTVQPEWSTEHRWQTQSVIVGAQTLELVVTARTNTGADDVFTFGYATAAAGPYTPTTLTVSSDVMTTDRVFIPYQMSGVLYFNVLDDLQDWANPGYTSSVDTIYIDEIRVEYYSPGGTLIQETVIFDRFGHGNVTGSYVMTQSIIPDSVEQAIEEVDLSIYSGDWPSSMPAPGPEPFAPGPEPSTRAIVVQEDFTAPWVASIDAEQREHGGAQLVYRTSGLSRRQWTCQLR